AHAVVARTLTATVRRQRAEITLDERPHRIELEAADEQKRKVPGVGEAVLVDLERSVEIGLEQPLGRQRAPSRMILIDEAIEHIDENDRGILVSIDEPLVLLSLVGLEQ